MLHRLLVFVAAVLLAAISAAAPEFDQNKFVGEWRYQDEARHQVASYLFRADGTFTAELRQDGKVVTTMNGRWHVEGATLVYIYSGSGVDQNAIGAREADRLLRFDDNSYTIQARDGNQRTYWRVKTDAQEQAK